MKKRLLITSIVMMLVVAVALSTATYAWFTSNNSVSASTVSLTAAVNDAPAIGIAWLNSSYGSSITAQSPTHVENDTNTVAETIRFAPMVPSAIVGETTTIASASPTSGIDFYSATTKDSPAIFNNDVKHWGATLAADQVKPYVWTNGTQTSFFLKNLSGTNSLAHVTLSATVDGKGADLIRIAVFARVGATKDADPSGNFTLKKILSNVYTYTEATSYTANTKYYTEAKDGTAADIADETAFTTYRNGTDGQANTTDDLKVYTRTVAAAAGTAYATSGSITAGHAVTTDIASNTTDNAVSIDLGSLGANIVEEIIVYVWTDGTALDDARAGEVASIKLDISATRN